MNPGEAREQAQNHFPVADFHCDALSKLLENPSIDFWADQGLDVTGERLRAGGVRIQCFAIYLSQKWGNPRFEHILRQIELYRSKVANTGGLRPLRWKEEAARLAGGQEGGPGWGMLSLEGVDGLEGNLFYAEMIFELGVRFLGVTWNYANWAADGVLEQRNGGFTEKGRKLIKWCNRRGMLLDVSHLSEAGFWELAELSHRPFIASHSNARAICNHPRNMTDDQIRAVIAAEGRIGLTFVPWFVTDDGEAAPQDLLRHIEHICALGGEQHLMFGSDFDGIDSWVKGLEHPGHYPALAELLLRHYSEELVKGWLYGNAVSYLARNLPSAPI
ncbi:membrane dipeptidase [Paenibacillus forsythiae]|uniref:Membrane dipeptidase n=1 Tax=Paenibacillus forsythiae TaxID=365616 RepID=A0ABU3H1A7_9BACL|nr:dipeptidase [Paenibacillus forsythiae]MDT3424601.1 membrane dipeptidase [Paenibacillus forsythiae]